MKYKYIILAGFLLALLTSVIPIPRSTVYGNECGGAEKNGLCYKYLPSHGFPIPFATTDAFESPASQIKWSSMNAVLFVFIFPLNWAIYSLAILVIVFVYKKITHKKIKQV